MSSPPLPARPWRGYAIVTLAYVVGLVVAAAVVKAAPPDWHPLVAVTVADLVATVAVFVFSFAYDNTSVYDP
ncbi:MAG: hypothetical protein MUC96_15490, partial [Myxococcaceae bacterium]|nr:hypothetical protein [Myxococcaceae bacterium]